MYVIGTAGHVDHGKSALVKALTGIDPDRLREEKERGMTIDLGFAWLQLPSGREVSIVDVPGHERFIKNMLAGVGGVDLALLVIAADESVMPQTREHLAILDLLQVKGGIVAITKKDLVDQDWLDLVVADVEEVLKPTSLAGAPIVPVSSYSGEGLPALLQTLDRQLDATQPRQDIGRPRLSIDRVFSVAGFGTVVTGTLIDGRLSVGQEVEILPRDVRTRIRGLQTHKHKVEVAEPGSRVAVNLQGVATTDLLRGDVLTTPGWLRAMEAVDVRLRAVADLAAPIRHNTTVSFHSGAAEVPARLRLLDRDELRPGEAGWAQIRLLEPVAAVKGDFFIVRSADHTLGGGQIVEVRAQRHRRLHSPTVQRLETLEKGTPEELVVQTLDRAGLVEVKVVLERAGLPPEQARAALQALLAAGQVLLLSGAGVENPQSYVASPGGWSRLVGQTQEVLRAYHAQFPLRKGMAREELKSRLKLAPRLYTSVVERLVAEGHLAEENGTYRLPAHQVRLNPAQQARADAFVKALAEQPFSPPSEDLPEPELLAALADQGKVVKVTENVVFAADAYRQMVERVVAYTRQNGKITVAEVRDLFGTSRKYALALMEHLDDEKVTLRRGDERVLRG